MKFGEHNLAKRKALLNMINDHSVKEATKPWKLVRIQSATISERQTHLASTDEVDSMIHNAGFTEASTRRFQEQFETLEDLNKINKALIATRLRMWKYAKQGQQREMEVGKLRKENPDLPSPFAEHVNRLDTPMKKLIELMNVHLEETQFNEIMILCIKNYQNSADAKETQSISDLYKIKSDLHEIRPSVHKCEKNRKETIRYYKFPPVEIPCSDCEICINDYEDKFFCVNCYAIMDKLSTFKHHKSKFKECKKKCNKWMKLRFEYEPHELIWGNRRKRPQQSSALFNKARQ